MPSPRYTPIGAKASAPTSGSSAPTASSAGGDASVSAAAAPETPSPAPTSDAFTTPPAKPSVAAATAVASGSPPKGEEKRAALLDLLRDAVAQVFSEAQGSPLGEGSFGVQSLIGVLEQIFVHGLNATQFGVFRQCVWWQYVDSVPELSSFLKSATTPFDGAVGSFRKLERSVGSIRAAPTPKTDSGRGRAFLRLALQQGQLSPFVQLLVVDPALLKLWYGEDALLRSEDGVCAVAALLSSLQALDFAGLQPFSALLDRENPFATPLSEYAGNPKLAPSP